MAQLDETGEGAAERQPYRRWTEESQRGHDGDGGSASRTRRIARWVIIASTSGMESRASASSALGIGSGTATPPPRSRTR